VNLRRFEEGHSCRSDKSSFRMNPEETTDLSKMTDKVYHIRLYVYGGFVKIDVIDVNKTSC
jgi:hypothetical protein